MTPASQAAAALARWLALRQGAVPAAEALAGLRCEAPLDACLALWRGEDLVVHALLADPGGPLDALALAAEALRRALEDVAEAVPGRVRACLHVLAEDRFRAARLREALLDHADGHFLSKVLVGRSVICLQDLSAAYSGRALVEPTAQDLAGLLAAPQDLPGEAEAAQWQGLRLREQRGLRRLLKPGPAPLTWLLLAANAAAFGWQMALAARLQAQGLAPGAADLAALRLLGANQSWAELDASGEWWRLLSAAFLHGGGLHLLMNLAALHALGGLAERLLGPWRLAAFYLGAILVSSAVSAAFLPPGVPSLGASGAILGLAGLLLAPRWRRHPDLPQALAQRLHQWLAQPIALVFALGLGLRALDLPLQFDNAAHLGGLCFGFALGYLFPSVLVRPQRRQG